jgi:DNA-directed RNA polymerase specialized sigma24 family protein
MKLPLPQADALLARARRLLHDHRTRAKRDGAVLNYGLPEVRQLLAATCCAYCGMPVAWDASIDHRTPTILGLPAERLWCLFDRLAGRPEVAAAGWHIAERRLTPRPNAERDAELLRLHDEDGLSYADIARAKHLRRGTVAKAIQRERRR